GLKEFYTDSDGYSESNPRFYRKGEKRARFYQRRVSRKKKGSSNRKKAINRLGRQHLKISRQREEHASAIRWLETGNGGLTTRTYLDNLNSMLVKNQPSRNLSDSPTPRQ
ncbi:transposase, partial [Moorena sp. SIO3I6]|uniref:transposase n=1 Tax=Moorena sp. SIO3I6 TaxID=2607831 RepID=UPI0025DC5186